MKGLTRTVILLPMIFAIFTVPVNAQTNNSPIIVDSPEDLTYEYGTSFNTISWIVEDEDPDFYVVLINGTHYENGTWFSLQEISITTDGLSIGISNVQIIFYDLVNQSTSDTVLVTVEDTTAPLITRVPDKEIIFESLFNFIRWGAIDKNPNNYVVTIDNEFFKEGFWVSGIGIAIQIDDLELGAHEVKITLYDDFDNYVQDLVIVTVVETNSSDNISSDTMASEGNNSSMDQNSTSNDLALGIFIPMIIILISAISVYFSKKRN